MRRFTQVSLTGLAIALACAIPVHAQEPVVTSNASALGAYPASPPAPVVEHPFGETVVDPWRWLEADVRTDAKVADWVKAQSSFTDAYLKQLPERPAFEKRLKALIDYERFSLPEQRGNRVFYRWNSGLLNQSQLLVGDADAPAGAKGRVLLDPASWAKDGATALDAWAPSDDGATVAYSVQDGGSDWRTIKFVRSADGAALADEIKWVKFSGLYWVGNDAVIYSRFAEPKAGEAFQALNYNQTVWLHRLGTPQSADVQVYATPEAPKLGHGAQVNTDGRWVVIGSNEGTDPVNAVHIARIAGGKVGPVTALVPDRTAQWDLIDGLGDVLWFVSGQDAPLKKIVRVDLTGPKPQFTTVVAQASDNLESATIVGDRIVASYLHDARSDLRLFTLDGKPAGSVALPGLGSVQGVSGHAGQATGFLSFTSFTTPVTILRLDPATAATNIWQPVKLTFDPADYRIEPQFYTSKDGTKIPLFVVRRKDAFGPVPTILYGYGGFNVSLNPWFSPTTMAWLESGGAYAVANLRGGGEYGDAWHDAGRRARKQNVFDDFIAAGEWLKANGVTPASGLAIEGASNGGLLIGAVTNQRPDLFAAANPGVGVMDMLRFDRFTAGRYWVDDYGYPEKEADWRVLKAYSPYHNVRSGRDYPAILVTTADTDDRVVPGHSFKYTAALQAAAIGSKPHLIRIETRAGHGSGKPIAKVIEEAADVQAFLAHWTGLQPRP
ncbi:prolyl oligopeptidase family serine peptidase [Novosphingobium sp.]|uniref:prolyl oligopeptidase family serine peptidase n=1 Tax=Novosphingobium sp. TaxID=1874826 RepID=UPI0038BA01CA